MAGSARKSQLNPVDPENLLDPIPLYKELRENAPVFWSDAVQAWLITRHQDVTNAFRDSRLSADRTRFLEHQLRLTGLGPDTIRDFIEAIRPQMVNKDGAEHLRLRRHASQSFTPQGLDTWRPVIHRAMDQLLDRVQTRGRMDLVTEVSYQLPPRVIAEFLGVPAEDRERFQSWAQPIALFGSPTVGMDMATVARQGNEAIRNFHAYLTSLLDERRRNPGTDMISRMIHFQEGGGMTPEEVVANANLILMAGHLTTTDQLSNGVHDLLTHPDQLQRLRENPLLIKSALEEIMRFHPAVPYIHRIAGETFHLHGCTIRKGDVVFLGMAAANRDPTVFPDPDRFDITRDHIHQKHLSFAFGPHHCLGAGLARREIEIAIELLLQRMPGLRLDEEQLPRIKCSSMLYRGLESLHIRW